MAHKNFNLQETVLLVVMLALRGLCHRERFPPSVRPSSSGVAAVEVHLVIGTHSWWFLSFRSRYVGRAIRVTVAVAQLSNRERYKTPSNNYQPVTRQLSLGGGGRVGGTVERLDQMQTAL